jgi:pyrimidine deaminase RibD-like protein/SAM-dependent methyltransferase
VLLVLRQRIFDRNKGAYVMLDPETISGLMRQAITEAENSQSEDSGVHPKVGALIVAPDGSILQRAHRGEEPGCHAEYLCIKKARDAYQNLEECLLFVTLEPCTARGPDKKACCTHILESGLKKVFIGMLDPNPAICGRGETRLRYDIGVERFPSALVKEIEAINKEFIELHKDAHLSEESLYVRAQIHHIMRENLVRKGIPLDEELPVGVDLTTSDIGRVCEAACAVSAVDIVGIDDLVEQARAEAFDKKYADRTYDDDGRGLGDHWKHAVRSILTEMGAPDFPKRRITVVGIGNGLEGQGLYADCTKLTAVDIAEKSLQRAARILRRATTCRMAAEDLKGIRTGSQDIYISLRTFQSTYFDRNAALREAYRVVRQGGIVLISVANGFLEQGSMIPGLLIPGTAVVDRNLGFSIASQIRARMCLLRFEEVGERTSLDEIYIYGRRGR